jgi:hypothetical protein
VRLGRVPLLGIDYGPSPESQFSSRGAQSLAKQGNFQWAYAYEELCKQYQEGRHTDLDADDYEKWERERRIIGSIFGENEIEMMELVKRECDPTHVLEKQETPTAESVRYTPPSTPSPQTQTYQNLQAKGMTADSQYSWNKGAPVTTPQASRPSIPTLPYGSLFNQSMTAAPLSMAPAASYGNYTGT